jgi:hypothetical protein
MNASDRPGQSLFTRSNVFFVAAPLHYLDIISIATSEITKTFLLSYMQFIFQNNITVFTKRAVVF